MIAPVLPAPVQGSSPKALQPSSAWWERPIPLVQPTWESGDTPGTAPCPKPSHHTAYYIVAYPATSIVAPGTSHHFQGDFAVGIDALSVEKVGCLPATSPRMGGAGIV